MSQPRVANLFKNGANQAVRIPKEFELDADRVRITRDRECLVIEPIKRGGLIGLLKSWDPIDIRLLSHDDELPPLDEPVL